MSQTSSNKPSWMDQAPAMRINPRGILAILIAGLVLIGVFTSYYTVEADSVAVVQRFGRFKTVVEPGLRFKIPFGIDTVTKVAVRRQMKMEFGFGTYSGTTNPDQFSDEPELEKNMVTGDLNAAEVEWVIQYHVSDPQAFLFNVREPGGTLRDVSESVMREVVGDRLVDEVLTFGRAEMQDDMLKKLQALVTRLELGVHIDQVQLNRVHPPRPVQSSFDEVNKAQQERETMINVANGEYNKVVPRAKGEAEQKISEAEGYAIKRVNEAEGDVARFKALLEQYEKAPDITRQRLYLETMAEVIPQLGAKIILDSEARQFLPLMHLQQFAPQAAPQAPAAPRQTPQSPRR
ncbi:FtsH protease activity modulator HflK [Roseimicrobium sp. ORNL1]|uniref:FtsH protease activity modulator HflK n=1 Tax=Roseimicrobium sp. ORNL1 TaxID=2711231 RepID=UPI00197FD7CD|nr:FtsH protease activity modulator HflK [Roseimicrobium sp. ORNL1]